MLADPYPGGPKLYLVIMIDVHFRWLLGAATDPRPDAELACAAIKMAAAARGGREAIWREDQAECSSTYTANSFTKLSRQLCIRQSIGRVGSCFDNVAAEALFSSLQCEVLSRHNFEHTRQAQAVVRAWCYGFYNHARRHSAAGMMRPINPPQLAGPKCPASKGPGPRIRQTSRVSSTCSDFPRKVPGVFH